MFIMTCNMIIHFQINVISQEYFFLPFLHLSFPICFLFLIPILKNYEINHGAGHLF